MDVPYLQPAPRQPWEPYGQACSLQAVHWLPKGLADYNPRSASPSDVWANDIVYHNPPAQGHGEKGNNSLFLVKRHRSDPKATAAVPFQGGSSCFGSSWRFFLSIPLQHTLFVARSDGNVPAWLVFLFQATEGTAFLSVHPIAHEKGRNITRVRNIFSTFFAGDKSAY